VRVLHIYITPSHTSLHDQITSILKTKTVHNLSLSAMDTTRSENATINAVHEGGVVETSDPVTHRPKDNDVEEIAPITTATDARSKPKSLDEPFKIR
jgi:hypothetical protein